MMEFKVRDFAPGDRSLVEKWVARLPEHLFKYRTLSGLGSVRLATLIGESILHFPTYAELNDPFDSNFSFDFAAPADVLEAYWRRALPDDLSNREAAIRLAIESSSNAERMANGSTAVRDLMSKFGVYCLTAKPDDILMWSYYAEGHAGVCLRFRSEGLFDSYCRDGVGMLVPVEYVPGYQIVPYFTSSVVGLVHAGIGTKAVAWKHEAEWRVVKPKASGLLRFERAALDGIILGCRISAEDERLVRGLAGQREAPIPVMKASKKESEYGIQIDGP